MNVARNRRAPWLNPSLFESSDGAIEPRRTLRRAGIRNWRRIDPQIDDAREKANVTDPGKQMMYLPGKVSAPGMAIKALRRRRAGWEVRNRTWRSRRNAVNGTCFAFHDIGVGVRPNSEKPFGREVGRNSLTGHGMWNGSSRRPGSRQGWSDHGRDGCRATMMVVRQTVPFSVHNRNSP